MAEEKEADPVAFFVGVLAADAELLPVVRERLRGEFGEIGFESAVLPFDLTDYYRKETGDHIVRQFFGFADLLPPIELASRKVRTNELEKELASELKLPFSRPVNLDPGYLTLYQVVLASAKKFYHRIYLGQGIHAEVTLVYRGGKFVALEWTFPDYASGKYDAFFHQMRRKLANPGNAENKNVG
jgi:hypothetical protein